MHKLTIIFKATIKIRQTINKNQKLLSVKLFTNDCLNFSWYFARDTKTEKQNAKIANKIKLDGTIKNMIFNTAENPW